MRAAPVVRSRSARHFGIDARPFVVVRDLILAVDPGADSTKVGLFRGLRPVAHHVALHQSEAAEHLLEQLPARTRAVRAFLDQSGVARSELAAVVGRGGALRPVESGTYVVDDAMLRELERGEHGEHPANLGVPIAKAIADDHGCPAFVVDPVSVDELDPVARLSGEPAEHGPIFCDALNMRAAARHHASAVQRPVDELRLVIAHLGGETSLSAMRDARLVEVVNGSCEPLSLGKDHLAERADRGDGKAIMLLDAKAYRIAKRIGELAVALGGEVDAVLLTGSAAHITAVVNGVCRRVEWIAPVFVYPGDDELHALAEGALRVLTGEESPKRYG